MLREVMKRFDIEGNITVEPHDIVDVTGWKNRAALEAQGYIGPTNAEKATVDQNPKPTKKKASSAAPKQPGRIKRSALASRPRVFS
ncbi:MAG: hypothetical protein ACXABD_21025 [Candidatus Thorarchaeota archaeon]|jgi:hypothetical protein